MGVLAQAENGNKQFCKWKFHAGNGKAQYAQMNDPVFFYLEGVRGNRIICFFFPCSQIGSPRCSQ